MPISSGKCVVKTKNINNLAFLEEERVTMQENTHTMLNKQLPKLYPQRADAHPPQIPQTCENIAPEEEKAGPPGQAGKQSSKGSITPEELKENNEFRIKNPSDIFSRVVKRNPESGSRSPDDDQNEGLSNHIESMGSDTKESNPPHKLICSACLQRMSSSHSGNKRAEKAQEQKFKKLSEEIRKLRRKVRNADNIDLKEFENESFEQEPKDVYLQAQDYLKESALEIASTQNTLKNLAQLIVEGKDMTLTSVEFKLITALVQKMKNPELEAHLSAKQLLGTLDKNQIIALIAGQQQSAALPSNPSPPPPPPHRDPGSSFSLPPLQTRLVTNPHHMGVQSAYLAGQTLLVPQQSGNYMAQPIQVQPHMMVVSPQSMNTTVVRNMEPPHEQLVAVPLQGGGGLPAGTIQGPVSNMPQRISGGMPMSTGGYASTMAPSVSTVAPAATIPGGSGVMPAQIQMIQNNQGYQMGPVVQTVPALGQQQQGGGQQIEVIGAQSFQGLPALKVPKDHANKFQGLNKHMLRQFNRETQSNDGTCNKEGYIFRVQ